MKIDRRYKVWKVASPDDARPILCHINVERIKGENGVAVAANGFAIVVVPVILADDDVPGPVRADLFEMAVKMPGVGGKKKDYALMSLHAERVTLFDDSNHRRTLLGEGPHHFPDWHKIMPQVAEPVEQMTGEAAFDPRYIQMLAEAMGVKPGDGGLGGLRLTFTGSDKVVVIEPMVSLPQDVLVPPYGGVMPMHATKRLRAVKRSERRAAS